MPLRVERRGFTLIETLAAFAILAMALAGLLQSLGLGVQNEVRADFMARASRQGKSQLERLGVDQPVGPGITTGRYDDGLVWSLEIGPYGAPAKSAEGATVAAYSVRLAIRPGLGSADEISFSAVKLAITKKPGL